MDRVVGGWLPTDFDPNGYLKEPQKLINNEVVSATAKLRVFSTDSIEHRGHTASSLTAKPLGRSLFTDDTGVGYSGEFEVPISKVRFAKHHGHAFPRGRRLDCAAGMCGENNELSETRGGWNPGCRAVLSVPATVVIPSGSPSATFTINTSPVATNTPVTITATNAGAAATVVVTVTP